MNITMTKKAIFIVILGVLAFPVFAEKQAENDISAIIKANNEFAFEIFSKVSGDRENIFLSPYSISTALAMVYAGSAGETEREMANVLNVPCTELKVCKGTISSFWPKEKYHKAYGDLLKQINAQGEKGSYDLVTANALWAQQGYEFLDAYLLLVENNYQGGLNEVDYKNAAETARQKINTWVEDKTKDKIKDLIKKGMVGKMTRLVLTNAIYFKGDWASQFKPERTKTEPFYPENGKQKKVDMMKQTKEFGYLQDDNFQLLEMPYINDELSMLIFLPNKGSKVCDIVKNLNDDSLQKWLGKLRKKEVHVYFPKFKMTWESSLNEVLGAMGMSRSFHQSADFSGMTGKKDLFISDVVHKAFIEVNEEGTEAAAATGVVMRVTSIDPKPIVFKADRPFVFLIRDNVSGSILFVGSFYQPKP